MPKGYVKGAKFERRVRDHFVRRGFYVIRSAGSKGLFDLIAIRADIVVGIQAKLDGYLAPNLRNAMIEIGRTHNILPVFAYRVGNKLVLRELSTGVESNNIEGLLKAYEEAISQRGSKNR